MPPGSTTAHRIEELARAEPERLGLRREQSLAPADIRVRSLGQGESYAAWLLEAAGSAPLVVRIARRPVSELPRPMAEEFAALALIPDRVGPPAVLLDASEDNPLASPYMVTGYVPGRERALAEWDDDLLAAHARQMAALHEQVFDRCGDITAPVERRSPALSLSDLFASSLAWWQRSHPEVVAHPAVSRLLPRVEAFVAAAAPSFHRLDRFALIHGDLVVPNILVDDAGTPRYVDWEWAEIGDPARDLAYIGGHVWAPPWYLPLDRARIRRFVDSYVRAVTRAHDDTVETLELRRGTWEVFERFFTSLHFRTRQGSPEDVQSGRYSSAVAQLTAGLDSRLD